MLNIRRTFQLGFHMFFSLYSYSAWNRWDRDASTAPTAEPRLRLHRGPGGHYHKGPNGTTLQLNTPKQ